MGVGLPEAGEALGMVEEVTVHAKSLEWFEGSDGIKGGVQEPWCLLKLGICNRRSVRWWECCVPDNPAT